MKLMTMQFFPAPTTSSFLDLNILLMTLFSNTLNLCSYKRLKHYYIMIYYKYYNIKTSS